jgi:large subunit ribosomal protein L10
MPISRQRKQELVSTYVQMLEGSSGFAVVHVDKLSVPQVQEIRKRIREAGGAYVVAKNTLMTKALEQVESVVPSDILQGTTAIIFGMDNFPGVAKALTEYISEAKLEPDVFSIKGGVLGGQQILDAAGVEAVTTLPTLPELQAQIIGMLVQPQQQLVNVLYQANAGVVNVLQAADAQLVNVLQAWVAKQEAEGGEGSSDEAA